MKKNQIDVVIVGAGPVGLFCAYLLHQFGIKFRIFDKKNHLSQHSKALALHIRTLYMFKQSGLIEPFLRDGHQVTGANFYLNSRDIVNIDFNNLDNTFNYCIDIPQNITEKILFEELVTIGEKVEWDTELLSIEDNNENKVSFVVKHLNGKEEQIQTKWLIACDGSHSKTRESLDINFIGTEYPEQWWLADLYIDWKLPTDKMLIFPSTDGPLACFPLGKNRYRLIIKPNMTIKNDPTIEDINTYFKKRTGVDINAYNPVWLSKFFVHHRQIEHYKKGRIFFAGDAAHVHSPAGGQGLNTGFQDIYNLIWKLALVNAGLGKEILLNSYESERKKVGREVLKKTDFMHRGLTLKNIFLIKLRNFILKNLFKISFFKKAFSKNLSQLGITYCSDIILNHPGKTKFIAGKFLDDFELINYLTKEKLSVYDITKPFIHHLFIFRGNSTSNASDLSMFINDIKTNYSKIIQVHCVNCENMEMNANINYWQDPEFIVHKKFNIKEISCLLIRPDQYIGMSVSPFNKNLIKKYLNKIFIQS